MWRFYESINRILSRIAFCEHDKWLKQTEICRVLNLSRSSCLDWVNAGKPTADAKDAVLLAQIKQVERENNHSYGVKKVHDKLIDKDIKVGRCKV